MIMIVDPMADTCMHVFTGFYVYLVAIVLMPIFGRFLPTGDRSVEEAWGP